MLFSKAVESTEGFIGQKSNIRNIIFKQITVGSVVSELEGTELIELKTSIDEQTHFVVCFLCEALVSHLV